MSGELVARYAYLPIGNTEHAPQRLTTVEKERLRHAQVSFEIDEMGTRNGLVLDALRSEAVVGHSSRTVTAITELAQQASAEATAAGLGNDFGYRNHIESVLAGTVTELQLIRRRMAGSGW
jgi:hypothetical protein